MNIRQLRIQKFKEKIASAEAKKNAFNWQAAKEGTPPQSGTFQTAPLSSGGRIITPGGSSYSPPAAPEPETQQEDYVFRSPDESVTLTYEKPDGGTLSVQTRALDINQNIQQLQGEGYKYRLIGMRSGSGQQIYKAETTGSYESRMKDYYRTRWTEERFIPFDIKQQIVKQSPVDIQRSSLLGSYSGMVYEDWLGVDTGARTRFETAQEKFFDIGWAQKNQRYDNPLTEEVESYSYKELKQKEPALYLSKTGPGQFQLGYDVVRWQREQDKTKAWYDIPYWAGRGYSWLEGRLTATYQPQSGSGEFGYGTLKAWKAFEKQGIDYETGLIAETQYSATKKWTNEDLSLALDVAGSWTMAAPIAVATGGGYGALKASSLGAKTLGIGSKTVTIFGAATIAPIAVGVGFGGYTYATKGKKGLEKYISNIAVKSPLFIGGFETGYSYGLGQGYRVDNAARLIKNAGKSFKSTYTNIYESYAPKLMKAPGQFKSYFSDVKMYRGYENPFTPGIKTRVSGWYGSHFRSLGETVPDIYFKGPRSKPGTFTLELRPYGSDKNITSLEQIMYKRPDPFFSYKSPNLFGGYEKSWGFYNYSMLKDYTFYPQHAFKMPVKEYFYIDKTGKTFNATEYQYVSKYKPSMKGLPSDISPSTDITTLLKYKQMNITPEYIFGNINTGRSALSFKQVSQPKTTISPIDSFTPIETIQITRTQTPKVSSIAEPMPMEWRGVYDIPVKQSDLLFGGMEKTSIFRKTDPYSFVDPWLLLNRQSIGYTSQYDKLLKQVSSSKYESAKFNIGSISISNLNFDIIAKTQQGYRLEYEQGKALVLALGLSSAMVLKQAQQQKQLQRQITSTRLLRADQFGYDYQYISNQLFQDPKIIIPRIPKIFKLDTLPGKRHYYKGSDKMFSTGSVGYRYRDWDINLEDLFKIKGGKNYGFI